MATTGGIERRSRWSRVDLASPAAMIGALAAIALVAGIGLVLMTLAVASPEVAIGTEARAGSVSVWVDDIEWLAHDHGGEAAEGQGDTAVSEVDDLGKAAEGQGDTAVSEVDELAEEASAFAMPNTMMAGTPEEGFQRLQVDLSLVNRGGADVDISPAAFQLRSRTGETWQALTRGTFNDTTLQGNHTMFTVVAFDVEEERVNDELVLVWTNGNDETRFSVSTAGGHHD